MKSIPFLGVALLFIWGCQATPTVTRSGDVKDIIIADDLSAGEIAVNPGDEVRWINKRTAPVRVVLLDPMAAEKQLSCKNNFGGLATPHDTAKLDMNETASVCFRDPGYFRYTVRMESARSSGEINVPGVIKVGGQGGQAVGQTSDQNRGRTSDQPSGGSSDQPIDKTSIPATSTTTTTTTTVPLTK